jgi:hypothetical protein
MPVMDSWYELPLRSNVEQSLFGATEYPDQASRNTFIVNAGRLYRSSTALHSVGYPKPRDRFCIVPGPTAWMLTMVRTGWHPTAMSGKPPRPPALGVSAQAFSGGATFLIVRRCAKAP